jgi:hypothetical protein
MSAQTILKGVGLNEKPAAISRAGSQPFTGFYQICFKFGSASSECKVLIAIAIYRIWPAY